MNRLSGGNFLIDLSFIRVPYNVVGVEEGTFEGDYLYLYKNKIISI